jgi:hypothetical protein
MKTYVKVALFVVTFIALAAILAALYMFNLKHTDMAKAKPHFVVSAVTLQKEFETDETAASKKYINKILEVTGKIASVKSGMNNSLNVSLDTENDLSDINCALPAVKDTSAFITGTEITLRGECSGYLIDVQLNNCALINKKK